MIVCGKPTFTDEVHYAITNPKVIIEILSPSTANYDYGQKSILYRLLSSFEVYVLVSQDEARVEIWRKIADNRWVLNTYQGLDTIAPIESVGVSLPLSEVYKDFEFPPIVEV